MRRRKVKLTAGPAVFLTRFRALPVDTTDSKIGVLERPFFG